MGSLANIISAVVLLSCEDTAKLVERGFSALGFDTQIIVGGSLVISGKRSLFEKQFAVELFFDDTGAYAMDGAIQTRALSSDPLPDSIKHYVSAIEFQAPPDFGPTDF